MNLKFDYTVVELDGENVVVPVENGTASFHGVLKLNDEGLAILNLIKDGKNEEEIVESLLKEYDISKVELTEFVNDFINSLRQEEIIID